MDNDSDRWRLTNLVLALPFCGVSGSSENKDDPTSTIGTQIHNAIVILRFFSLRLLQDGHILGIYDHSWAFALPHHPRRAVPKEPQTHCGPKPRLHLRGSHEAGELSKTTQFESLDPQLPNADVN
jgi:hypothetical protein